MNNPLINTRIEFHILQSFPVTCLNRDDVGAPKTAIVGGATRARVSSQCWKRQVRLVMNELLKEHNISSGMRTKLISKLISNACIEQGASAEQAHDCAEIIEQIFIKKDKKTANKKKLSDVEEGASDADDTKDNDTLIFLSPGEINTIGLAFKSVDFVPKNLIKQTDSKKQAKELEDILNRDCKSMDALDIATFGRMVAKAASLNVEAAASFSHAISTHKVSNEVEFFTALDDLQEEPGSAHMGSLEFNSATYYRYISLDLGQLWQTLGGEKIQEAIEAFTKALFVAVPSARQTTQSGASPWEFAKVFVRKGQRLQVPFETAVRAKEGGFLHASIDQLKVYLEKKEKLAGSLFGKINEYTFGEDENYSIDQLVSDLKSHAVDVEEAA